MSCDFTQRRFDASGFNGGLRIFPVPCMLLTCAALLLGCATQNQTGGGLAGAVVGAVAGKAVGGDRGALVGALIGAAIGQDIGKRLDERDRQRLAEARNMALAQNQAQKFYAESAKAQISVDPTRTYTQSKQLLVLDSDVASVAVTMTVPFGTDAHVDTPIYRAPSYSTRPKLVVSRGTPIMAIAKVDESDWVLVGRGEYGMGYVHSDYFKRDIIDKLASSKPTGRPPKSSVPTKPPVTTSGGRTDTLLSDANSVLPPADHLAIKKTDAGEYSKAAFTGNANASAALKGDKRALGTAKVAPIKVECTDLTTTLLSDNKQETKETSTVCRDSAGKYIS